MIVNIDRPQCVSSNTDNDEINVMTNEVKREQFILTEYHESANAYFKGVELMFNTTKGFVTINGLFAALIGALSSKDVAISGAADMIRMVPWLAIITSLGMFFAVPHAFNHLENCRARCQSIEEELGGRMFTNLGFIGNVGAKYNAQMAIQTIIGVIVLFWGNFILKNNFGGIDVWLSLSNLISSIWR